MAEERMGRRRDGWRIVLISAMAAAVVFLLCGTLVTLQSVERLAPRGQNDLEAAEQRVAALGRQLDQLKQREQLLEWIQEEIQGANPTLEVTEAREYGRLLLEITEKYGTVDPVFLLAIGIVESRFTTDATSHARAKGLYQIWPATGRWLASELGWEFSEMMLYEPDKNTELAACYLEKLFHTYRDPRLVLAEYNGGPINARHLKNGSHRLAAETRDYVVKVMSVHDGLNRRLDLSPVPTPESQQLVRVAALETTGTFLQ
jgi:soluble lytic murein transglycosylase-like protein